MMNAPRVFKMLSSATTLGARGLHAPVAALTHQIFGFGHVLLLCLNLLRGQADPRRNPLARDGLIAAIEHHIVTFHHRVTRLDEAGVDIAGRCIRGSRGSVVYFGRAVGRGGGLWRCLR